MLSDFSAMPVLAVTDLTRARAFYEDTLGFRPANDVPDGVMYRVGAVDVLVYPSAYAGTNRATAMALRVPAEAFDDEVAELRRRGVTFQTFDMDGLTWTDGVAEIQGMKAVWFADPDGNIINVGADPQEASGT